MFTRILFSLKETPIYHRLTGGRPYTYRGAYFSLRKHSQICVPEAVRRHSRVHNVAVWRTFSVQQRMTDTVQVAALVYAAAGLAFVIRFDAFMRIIGDCVEKRGDDTTVSLIHFCETSLHKRETHITTLEIRMFRTWLSLSPHLTSPGLAQPPQPILLTGALPAFPSGAHGVAPMAGSNPLTERRGGETPAEKKGRRR
jgi:hypothetical protein